MHTISTQKLKLGNALPIQCLEVQANSVQLCGVKRLSVSSTRSNAPPPRLGPRRIPRTCRVPSSERMLLPPPPTTPVERFTCDGDGKGNSTHERDVGGGRSHRRLSHACVERRARASGRKARDPGLDAGIRCEKYVRKHERSTTNHAPNIPAEFMGRSGG